MGLKPRTMVDDHSCNERKNRCCSNQSKIIPFEKWTTWFITNVHLDELPEKIWLHRKYHWDLIDGLWRHHSSDNAQWNWVQKFPTEWSTVLPLKMFLTFHFSGSYRIKNLFRKQRFWNGSFSWGFFQNSHASISLIHFLWLDRSVSGLSFHNFHQ